MIKKYLIVFSIFSILISMSAFADKLQDVIDKIVAIDRATPENEAWLQELFAHPDEGVSASAKMRMAELYWRTGRLQKAETMLGGLLSRFETYSPKYQVEILFNHVMFEERRTNFIKAEEYARRATELAESSHPPLAPDAYFLLGRALREQKKYVEAMNILEFAANEYERLDNMRGMYLSYNSIGLMYKNSGDLSKGIKYLLKSREAVEQLDRNEYKAVTYYNLGDVFLASGEPQKAAEYYQRALELDLQLGDLISIAIDYTGLANVMLKLEQNTEALQNNQQAIKHLVQLKAPRDLSRAYLQQATIYTKLDEQEDRLKSLRLAFKYAEQAESPYQLMSVNIGIGQYYLDQQNFASAKDELTKALNVAEELSLDNNKLQTSRLLATTYENLNNYERAHYFSKQSLALQQKLNTEDQRDKTERYKRDLNLLEEQLKVSQLEQTKAQQEQALQAQAEVQKRFYMMAGIVAVLLLAGMFVLWQRRKLSLLRVKLYQDALEQKQQLFADVSHELRTPLTALKLQIEALENNLIADVQSGYQKLSKKVSEINRLIADIYQLAKADSLSMDLQKKECELTTLFNLWQQDWAVLVESAGFAWRCQLDVANASLMMDADRIKQVIDNLLSNSTFYTDTPGQIALAAKYTNNKLLVSVQDSAPTVDKDKLEKIFTRLYRIDSSRSRQTGGSGLGLAICESLIKAHGGEIRAEQSELGGLKVTFRI